MTSKRPVVVALTVVGVAALLLLLLVVRAFVGLRIGDDSGDGGPVVRNGTEDTVRVVKLDIPSGHRTFLSRLAPGEGAALSSVNACAGDRSAVLAESLDGELIDRWDDRDCGGYEDVPDEWRITESGGDQ